MANYRFEGQDYSFPDDVSGEEVLDFLSKQPPKGNQAPAMEQPAPEAPVQQPGLDASVTTAPVIKKQSELYKDPYFVAAAKYIRDKELLLDKEVERLQMQIDDPMSSPLERDVAEKALKLKKSRDLFKGTDEEYAEWGMNRIGWFLYNLPTMMVDAAEISYSTDQSEKEAFLYLMEAYERTDPSLAGLGRWAKGASLDPTTWTGIGSLGAGLLARAGGQQLTKEGFKALLKEGVRVGTIAAIDTATVAAAQDNMKQSIEVSAGVKQGTDWAQTGKAALIGGAFGFALGGALGAGAGALGQRAARNKAAAGVADDAADIVDGVSTRQPDTPDTLSLKADADEIMREAAPAASPEAPSGGLDASITSAPVISDTLPKDLAGAKPRYNYGRKGFGLEFESDVERALFITSQKNPSKRDADYRAWLKTQGYTDAEINTFGAQVRDHIKGMAKGSEDEVLQIGKVVDRKAPEAPQMTAEAPSATPEVPTTPKAETPTGEAPIGSGNKSFDDLVAAIKSVVPERLPDGTVARLSAEQIADTVTQVSRTLQDLKLTDAQNLEGVLRGVGVSPDQITALKIAAQKAFEQSDETSKRLFQAVQNAVGDDAKAAATKVWDEFEALRARLGDLDTGLSSQSGSDLGSRVGGKYVGENRGLGRDMILEQMGVRPDRATIEQKMAAQEKFIQLENRIQSAIDMDRRIKELTDEYYRLTDEGKHSLAEQVFKKREDLKVELTNALTDAQFGKQMYGWFNKYVANPANEIAIANVFSTGTLVVNTVPAVVKTVIKPALNALIKGGVAEKNAWKEAAFFYSALRQAHELTKRAAAAAFRYERSLISADPARVIEHTPSIPGLTGRVIRTIPRVVNAIDEYVKRANYTAYKATQAYADALESGAQQGLKGADLENFARQASDEAVANAFTRAPAEDITALISRDADLRGLTGEARAAYVNERVAKDADLFARMKENTPAKDYAENMTFTKPFSGDNAASATAKSVEEFMQRHPLAKLAFQLFWRTPIRIYEEGIRLTPGINLIAPNFMADLRGVNGTAAQVRAQGEAMLSISFGAAVMSMYGNGTIVGNGPVDPKQRKIWLANNTPNVIVLPNGKKVEFNRLEPFNIPLKLFVGVADRVRDLHYRQRQGEYVEKEWKEALAWGGVALGSVASLFKDAGIAGGVENYIKFVESLADPEKHEQAIQQLVADKARMLIPSIYTKAIQQLNGGLDLPQFNAYTLEQMIMTRINPVSTNIPLRHDTIGNPMTTSYSSEWEKALRIWGNIGIQTGDPHFDKLSPQKQYILTQVQKLAYATGSSYDMPYKVQAFGDFDLRSTKTADGKEFYYDRISRYAIELGMHDALEQAFRQMEGMSMGRKSIDGVQPKQIQNIFSMYRNAAIRQVMSEESGLRSRFIQQKTEKMRTIQGEYEVLSRPFSKE